MWSDEIKNRMSIVMRINNTMNHMSVLMWINPTKNCMSVSMGSNEIKNHMPILMWINNTTSHNFCFNVNWWDWEGNWNVNWVWENQLNFGIGLQMFILFFWESIWQNWEPSLQSHNRIPTLNSQDPLPWWCRHHGLLF
jgi:hypothetical protein